MNKFKSVWYGLSPIALAIIISSCGDSVKPEEQVKQFAADFATKVSNNQKDSLAAIWPDVAKADSLALTFVADSIRVEPTQTAGQYKVTMGSADMLVTLAEDGKMTVGETHGLFAYPDDKVSMALATGWITKDLNDTQIAERFTDSLFVNSLADNLIAGLKSKLRASCKCVSSNMSTFTKTYAITVTNSNDFDVPSEAYTILATEWGWDCDRLMDVPGKTKSLGGVMVKANSSATLPVPGTYDLEYSSGFKTNIRINYTKDQAVKNLLHPTGNEYNEYLEKKNK